MVKVKRYSAGEKTGRIVNTACIVLFLIAIIAPFLNIIALSLNDGMDAQMGGISFWPRAWTLDNYREVFEDPDLLNAYKITILRVVIGTASSVLLTALAAYALKFPTLPGRTFFTMMILFTMLFSGGIVPYYILLKSIGLTNRFWVYIIPGFYSAWNILLMRTFFGTIPASLEESAKLDGANDFRIFFAIILPISKPVISVIALFNGVGHWNDWFAGTFFVSDKALHPLQTVLRAMLMSAEALRKRMFILQMAPDDARLTVTTESLKMATIIVATIPVVLIYPFIQKYFVKGVMIGSVKG
ncbi:MAG: carbohydrate ABC transporter permease [Spirochaetales bacterium]|jgi:putative aldouronate transport system permease protein|nr:carbohydrate ABC transporter permease [Spirochaetales bacterium]